MKILRSLFLATLIIAYSGSANAQPSISKDMIPKNISENLKHLIEKLYDGDPIARAEACMSIGATGKKALPAMPFLIAMLGDNYSLTYGTTLNYKFTSPGGEAAIALAQLGEEAVAPLIAVLRNNSATGRDQAARALGILKSKLAVQPLIEALDNPDVKRSASWALSNITGKNFGTDRLKWQEWWEQNDQSKKK
jgi:HEAT repeat protein